MVVLIHLGSYLDMNSPLLWARKTLSEEEMAAEKATDEVYDEGKVIDKVFDWGKVIDEVFGEETVFDTQGEPVGDLRMIDKWFELELVLQEKLDYPRDKYQIESIDIDKLDMPEMNY